MESVNPPNADLENAIGKIEVLLKKLKQLQSPRPRTKTWWDSRTHTRCTVRQEGAPTPDHISDTLTSIINEATNLLNAHKSPAINQGEPSLPSLGKASSALSPAEPDAPPSPAELNTPSPIEPDTLRSPAEPDTLRSPTEPERALSPAEPDTQLSPTEPDTLPLPAEPPSPAEPEMAPSPTEPDTFPPPAEPEDAPSPAELDRAPSPAEPPSPTEPDMLPSPAEPDSPLSPAEPDTPPSPAQLSKHGSSNRPVKKSSVAFEHEVDSGVLVLQPSSDQWQDFPSIIASAEALGAYRVGAFKVRLPAELHHPLPSREETAKARWCNGYCATALPNKTYRVGMPLKRQVLRPSPLCSLSTNEAFEQHEMLLSRKDGLDSVFYRTDISAETHQQRATNCLPEESMIWPLKGNLLSKTKCSIPGLHWPYAYESGSEFGASFSDHVEHFGLYSISHLHVGRKLWRIIPPSAADAFVEKLKESDSEITWECDQCVRHAGVFVPVSTLKEWGIPFTIVDQKASEIIITVPWAYHSGFSTGYTLAEAVNYAGGEWTPDAHTPCLASCPDHPILVDSLAFLGPGEEQQRVGEVENGKPKGRKGKGRRPKEQREPAGGNIEHPRIFPALPLEPAEQIPQMINYILSQQFPQRWLDCEDEEAFRARLEQFLPGGQLDQLLLVKIVRVICRGSRLIAFDFDDVKLIRARIRELLHTYDGLVLPVSTAGCWTLLVVDWRSGKLTSIGMDEQEAEDWITIFGQLVNAELQHNIQERGGYVGDSGIFCCFALEKYLGTVPHTSGDADVISLQARYLTSLLKTWISLSELEVFAGENTADQPDPTGELLFVQPYSTEKVSTCTESHECFLADLETHFPQGGEGWVNGDLGMEVKARVLQMVMQCSAPPTGPETHHEENQRTVGGLVAKLTNIRQKVQRYTFEQRFTLALLAQKYQGMLEEVSTGLQQSHSIRKRQWATNGSLEPKKRQQASTIALENIATQQTTMTTGDLKACINEGLSLLFLGSTLGYHILATFPCDVIRPHEFAIDFPTTRLCFKSLSKPINPNEYNNLQLAECFYFIKAFQILRPDLGAASIDPHTITWVSKHTKACIQNRPQLQWNLRPTKRQRRE
ncbi:hypothetical protein B0T25DRAFT_528717 [Lasiosphaeria hispida]|uniref:JmjC domain-containing protein n=1 Tax=Lasiosphaeria hispida TaxID=260671 RepID=A0AAJ0MKM1_9PEZI|nr:hypothetical protein B0T25DRAFT_528717 [Lasiosphaeria hispida]